MKKRMGITGWMGATLALALVAGVAPAMAQVEGKVSYEPAKGLILESEDGDFKFRLTNRVQFRYTHVGPDEGDDIGSFRVRRFKFKMDGHAYGYWKYKLQVNFASGSVEGSNDALLEDAYLQYTKNHWVQPFMGQGKAYFARQSLASSGKQQFVDRSIVTSGGGAEVARQIGVGLVGRDKDKRFEYNLGIYNGDGSNNVNKKVNENDKFLYVGRVVWTPFGEMKTDESAHSRPESSKLAVGVKAAHDTRTEEVDPPDGDPDPDPEVNDPPPFDADRDIASLGAELAYKIEGFSFVGEYFRVMTDQFVNDTGAETEQIDSDLYYVQAGYLFPNSLELAGRYAVIDAEETQAVDDKLTEYGAAISYYFLKHSYKVQADYRRITSDASPENDIHEGRVQFQLVF